MPDPAAFYDIYAPEQGEVTGALDDHPERTAAAALFFATLTIALSSVLVRRSYELGGTPEAVVVLRTGTPAILFGALIGIDAVRGRIRAHLTRSIVVRLLLLGAFLLGGSMGELYALERLEAPIAILFFALAPLWISVLSRVLYGTRLGARRTVALAVALCGVAIVVGAPTGEVDPIGALFAAGGGLSASGSFLLLEGQLSRAPIRLVWGVALTIATAVGLALNPDALSTVSMSRHLLAVVIAAGSLAGLAQLLATVGVRAVGAIVAGIATCLEPVNTAVLAWLILDETVGLSVVVGGCVVLLGVFLALTAPSLRRPADLIPAPSALEQGAGGQV